jgi:hypothetical protein
MVDDELRQGRRLDEVMKKDVLVGDVEIERKVAGPCRADQRAKTEETSWWLAASQERTP